MQVVGTEQRAVLDAPAVRTVGPDDAGIQVDDLSARPVALGVGEHLPAVGVERRQHLGHLDGFEVRPAASAAFDAERAGQLHALVERRTPAHAHAARVDAALLAQAGERLEPGDIVLAGAATAAVPLAAGQAIRLQVQNMGAVALDVEA